jgi:hypothetical protein
MGHRGEVAMLSLLYKDDVSGGGGCPSVYAEDGAGAFVVVGDRVDQDPAVAVGLTDLLLGEVAVRIPEEVLLGAAEEHVGRPVRRDATAIEPLTAEWDALLRGFEHSAFRLEVLQHYAMPYEDESFRRFLADEPPVADPALDEWLELVGAARAAGKRMARVHVVVEPLSDYLRYELTRWYPFNVAAGEDVRILPTRQRLWPGGLPRHDFWLYDSQKLAVLHYDPEGRLYRAELVRDPAEVVRHNAWRDVAMHQAVPLGQYLERYPDLQARVPRPWKEEVADLPARA